MPYNVGMKRLGAILKVMRSPVEGIVAIFSTGLFAYACYLLGPWYHTVESTSTAGVTNTVQLIMGTFFAITTLPGLIAPFMRKERRERSLKLATFSVFVSFLFLFILRVVYFGWLPWTWLPLLMISVASGYLHVWLKVRKE